MACSLLTCREEEKICILANLECRSRTDAADSKVWGYLVARVMKHEGVLLQVEHICPVKRLVR